MILDHSLLAHLAFAHIITRGMIQKDRLAAAVSSPTISSTSCGKTTSILRTRASLLHRPILVSRVTGYRRVTSLKDLTTLEFITMSNSNSSSEPKASTILHSLRRPLHL
ncbi:hypothetical protein V6Z11_D07G089200 [Gossypium hirsutum]